MPVTRKKEAKENHMIFRRLYFGDSAPWGWGLAWRDHRRQASVLAPIPLNLAIRLFWLVYWGVAFRWAGGLNRKERAISEAIYDEAKRWRSVRMQRDVAFEMLKQISGMTHDELIKRIDESLP